MSQPNLSDFYRRGVGRGDPFVEIEQWATSSTPALTIAAKTDYIKFVKKLIFIPTANFALNGGDKLEIVGWHAQNSGTTKLEIADLMELMSIGDDVRENLSLANTPLIIVVNLESPVKLTATGAEQLIIQNSGGATQTITGTIDFSVRGWTVKEADY
jgi:hypothetical protein